MTAVAVNKDYPSIQQMYQTIMEQFNDSPIEEYEEVRKEIRHLAKHDVDAFKEWYDAAVA